MTEDLIPPAGLHPELVKRLLDHLETSDEFRTTFKADPEKALRSIGYQDPWTCMQFDEDATLASPEDIRAQREKLEVAMTSAMTMNVFKL